MKLVEVAFSDRDGVINSNKINKWYIGSIKHSKWVPGAKKAGIKGYLFDERNLYKFIKKLYSVE